MGNRINKEQWEKIIDRCQRMGFDGIETKHLRSVINSTQTEYRNTTAGPVAERTENALLSLLLQSNPDKKDVFALLNYLFDLSLQNRINLISGIKNTAIANYINNGGSLPMNESIMNRNVNTAIACIDQNIALLNVELKSKDPNEDAKLYRNIEESISFYKTVKSRLETVAENANERFVEVTEKDLRSIIRTVVANRDDIYNGIYTSNLDTTSPNSKYLKIDNTLKKVETAITGIPPKKVSKDIQPISLPKDDTIIAHTSILSAKAEYYELTDAINSNLREQHRKLDKWQAELDSAKSEYEAVKDEIRKFKLQIDNGEVSELDKALKARDLTNKKKLTESKYQTINNHKDVHYEMLVNQEIAFTDILTRIKAFVEFAPDGEFMDFSGRINDCLKTLKNILFDPNPNNNDYNIFNHTIEQLQAITEEDRFTSIIKLTPDISVNPVGVNKQSTDDLLNDLFSGLDGSEPKKQEQKTQNTASITYDQLD